MTEKNNLPTLLPTLVAPKIGKPFPTVGDLFAMLGIVFGMQIAAGVVAMAATLCLGLNPLELDPLQRGRFMAASYLLSWVPALLLVLRYRRVRGGRGPIGCFSTRGVHPVLLGWAFLFMAAVGVVCEPLLSSLPGPTGADPGRGFWALLTVTVAAPVSEEILCRGVVLGALRDRYGVMAAWAGSALFFGVLHVQPVLVVNAFVIGLILGYIYMVSRSLWSSIILHALNNAVAYGALAAGYGDTTLRDLLGAESLAWRLAYAGALVVSAGSAWMAWRTLRRLRAEAKIGPAA